LFTNTNELKKKGAIGTTSTSNSEREKKKLKDRGIKKVYSLREISKL